MVRIGGGQHRHRTVSLGVENLGVIVRVACVALAVKDGVRIGLLRLVIENQNHLTPDIDAGIVVVLNSGAEMPKPAKTTGPATVVSVGKLPVTSGA